jgi:hypothetical protein
MNKYKYLTKEFTIANGSGSGLSRIGQDITVGYERCVGICFTEQTNGGNANYKIGFSDDNNQYIDPVPCEVLKFSSALEIQKRFLDIDIPGNGNKVYIDVVLPANTGSDMKCTVVFKLLKGEIKKNC